MRREALVGCLLWPLPSAVPCGAATFIVNRTEDDPTATACDETLPPESRNCSLRGAIIAANLSPGADTITLPMGTYLLGIPGPEPPLPDDPATRGDLDISGADVTVFDASRIQDRATYLDPHQYPVGIHHVLVNGVPIIRGGALTGAKPGRALSGPARPK